MCKGNGFIAPAVEDVISLPYIIEKRDPVLAKKAMAGHLRNSEREALRAGKPS